MLSIVGYLLVIFSTTIAGFAFGENFKKRVIQLKEFQRAIYELENDIVYTYTPLPCAFEKISENSIFPIKDILKDISISLKQNEVNSVYEAFDSTLSRNKDYLCIKKEDINIILDFSKTLGQSDLEGEKRVFNLTLDNLKKQIEKADELMDKNVKMYRYLGFSLGAMIVILLI